jgi:hypothetical protein
VFVQTTAISHIDDNVGAGANDRKDECHKDAGDDLLHCTPRDLRWSRRRS